MNDVGRPARLLLSGYYGFNNFGDEAILEVFVKQWRARRPDDVISVLSEHPEETRGTFGVDAVKRSAWGALSEAIRSCDVLVSGGGGLLQSATSLRSLLYYTSIIREAKRAGRKAAIFAQGIGPLNYFGREVVKRSCASVDLACVRDEMSQSALQPLLPHVDVKLCADPVFLADDDVTPAAHERLRREGLAAEVRDVVAVVVRRGALLDQLMEKLASIVDMLARKCGAHVVFVPLQPPHDAEAASNVIRRCTTAPVLLGGDGVNLETLTALLTRCSAVISMRLHALILAARLGVPFLAVPHDPKIVALLRSLAYPLPPLARDSLTDEVVERLWTQRAALGSALRARGLELQTRAKAGFDWLQQLAEGSLQPDR